MLKIRDQFSAKAALARARVVLDFLEFHAELKTLKIYAAWEDEDADGDLVTLEAIITRLLVGD